MWLDLVIDVLMPTGRSRSAERPDKNGKTIPVEVQVPGAFKRSLNESGELDEAIAAGVLRQGRPHSVIGLISGLALFELARRRESKSLPREFVLAVTRDRVVAFALSLVSEGTETTTYVVKIKRGERGSWPRELVRLVDQSRNRPQNGGMLELAGERIPVVWEDGSSSTDEAIAALGG